MIALRQRVQVLSEALLARLRGGRPPSITGTLPEVARRMQGRRFGAPFIRLRHAHPGQPIGGESGTDLQRNFEELKEDLDLLYTELVASASRIVDLYEIFATRKDRLELAAQRLRLRALTRLAQQQAGSRTSVTDSFNTLDQIDPDLTTARIDLEEGIATLAPDTTASVKYDGSRVQLVRQIVPPGSLQPGPSFDTAFSPYRLDGWYASIPVGHTFEAHVNVTGADFERGEGEELRINALRIEPTGPIHVEIQWSPEGRNWHHLNPRVDTTLRERATFYFAPVAVGFLRFRLRHSDEVVAAGGGGLRGIGVKRIELFERGFASAAQLYSREYRFAEPVGSVVADLDVTVPFGTRITPYLSQSREGPWLPIQDNHPITFDTRVFTEVRVNLMTEEDEGHAGTFWQMALPSARPLPQTGELIAGRDQLQIAAFPYDWRLVGDRDRIPEISDFEEPPAQIRTGVFQPIGGIGTPDAGPTSFIDSRNPLAFEERPDGRSFMVLALLQGDGNFVLQPGYNYRVRAYPWCPTATTLENRRIGVVNTGGTPGAKVAPLALFVNGRKIYQQTVAATSVDALSGSQFLATIPLNQGYNEIDLLIQLPQDLTAGEEGLAANSVFVYMEPNLFSRSLENTLGIRYIQAYRDPWKRVSEFDLRYNVPPGRREAWTFKHNLATNEMTHLLLNHDPTNSANRIEKHPSFTTLDGVLAGYPVDLLLRYPAERASSEEMNILFFRADFSRDEGASSPPVMKSYRLLVNGL